MFKFLEYDSVSVSDWSTIPVGPQLTDTSQVPRHFKQYIGRRGLTAYIPAYQSQWSMQNVLDRKHCPKAHGIKRTSHWHAANTHILIAITFADFYRLMESAAPWPKRNPKDSRTISVTKEGLIDTRLPQAIDTRLVVLASFFQKPFSRKQSIASQTAAWSLSLTACIIGTT